jgi:hypothetical protein
MLRSLSAKIRQPIGAAPWPDQSELWRHLIFIFCVMVLSQRALAWTNAHQKTAAREHNTVISNRQQRAGSTFSRQIETDG